MPSLSATSTTISSMRMPPYLSGSAFRISRACSEKPIQSAPRSSASHSGIM